MTNSGNSVKQTVAANSSSGDRDGTRDANEGAINRGLINYK